LQSRFGNTALSYDQSRKNKANREFDEQTKRLKNDGSRDTA
jgi:hypothetical protein